MVELDSSRRKRSAQHAITPAPAGHEVGRLVHLLHAARHRARTLPAITSSAADTIACAPEPQTRLTVRAGMLTGKPALMAACLAGFIFAPAWIT